jgi:hypothetical protein
MAMEFWERGGKRPWRGVIEWVVMCVSCLHTIFAVVNIVCILQSSESHPSHGEDPFSPRSEP